MSSSCFFPIFIMGTLFTQRKLLYIICTLFIRGRHGRDRLVIGFTTTYTISAYHH